MRFIAVNWLPLVREEENAPVPREPNTDSLRFSRDIRKRSAMVTYFGLIMSNRLPKVLPVVRPYCFKPEVQAESAFAAVTDPLTQQVPGCPATADFTNVYARHCSCSEHALRHTS